NADDVLVRDLAGEQELVLEALDRARIGLAADGLERDLPVELAVAGAVDAAHPALADDLQDLVAVTEQAREEPLARRLRAGRGREEGTGRPGLGRARRLTRRPVEEGLAAPPALEPLRRIRLTASAAPHRRASEAARRGPLRLLQGRCARHQGRSSSTQP